jgi:DNA polymerase III sliding clamp (beta) subunit (PCNA family)
MELKSGHIRIIATDAIRIAIVSKKHNQTLNYEQQILAPSKTIYDLLNVLKEKATSLEITSPWVYQAGP